MKKVVIINTQAGNLFSLKAAVERLGFEVTVLDKPNNDKFDAIVIPGQGRFGTVLKNLRKNNWDKYLNTARKNSVPMLGICVGMQIFFEASDEDPGEKGFCWFKGKSEALDFPKKPMVGWAELNSDVWPEKTVYFVNSYAIKNSDYQIATTFYGETFCAAVECGSYTGVQFHPEKSSNAGSEIIRQALTTKGKFQ